MKRLAEARSDVARAEREAQATGVSRAKAMSAHDSVFTSGAGFISTTLSLVGEHDLAEKKTRPSTRRAGTTSTVEEAGGAAVEGGTETRSKRELPLREGHFDRPGAFRSLQKGR